LDCLGLGLPVMLGAVVGTQDALLRAHHIGRGMSARDASRKEEVGGQGRTRRRPGARGDQGGAARGDQGGAAGVGGGRCGA
jgi:hypothetical protein